MPFKTESQSFFSKLLGATVKSSADPSTMTKDDRNAVGDKIRRLRYKLKLSQPELARKCQLIGWNIGRDTIAKIEDRRRWVGDFELVGLAIVLRVKPEVLLPSRQDALELCRAAVKSSH